MKDPWDQEAAPELATQSIADKLETFSLSCRHSDAAHTPRFGLGQFLADLHANDSRYTDLHSGNYGILPIGGLIIIDPGGVIDCPLDPERMADDFIVPAMELTRGELVAFIAGYIERAYTSIEPRFEGFTDAVLRSLNLKQEQITYDPRPRRQKPTCIKTLLYSEPDEKTELLRVSIACLAFSSGIDRGLQEGLLASLFCKSPRAAWNAGTQVADFLKSTLSQPDIAGLIQQLFANRPLGVPPQIQFNKVPFRSLSPKSREATRIVETLNNGDVKNSRPLRNAIIECCFLVARQAGKEDTRTGLLTAAKLATLGFAIATESSTDVARYEYLHYRLRLLLNSLPTAQHLSLERGDATGIENALATSLLYFHAGLFEMAFFGATFAMAKTSDENVCWFTVLDAIGFFRRALIVIAMSLPMVAEPNEKVPSPFLTTASGILSGYLHACRLIAAAASEFKELPVLHFWGGSASTFIDNLKWVEEAARMCSDANLVSGTLFAIFERGRQYFLFEDFELTKPDGVLKLRRQDVVSI